MQTFAAKEPTLPAVCQLESVRSQARQRSRPSDINESAD